MTTPAITLLKLITNNLKYLFLYDFMYDLNLLRLRLIDRFRLHFPHLIYGSIDGDSGSLIYDLIIYALQGYFNFIQIIWLDHIYPCFYYLNIYSSTYYFTLNDLRTRNLTIFYTCNMSLPVCSSSSTYSRT